MEELLSNLKIELEISADNTSEDELLTRSLNRAIKKVARTRYPFGYTDAQKEKTIEQYEDAIVSIAVFLYDKRGAEGQIAHSENGVYRTYKTDDIPDSYLADIVPYVEMF